MRSKKSPEEPPSLETSPVMRIERLWTIQDVSAFLCVPVATIYQWRVRGEGPPAFKLGRHIRFDPERVKAWLAESAA
jgi:excisionase family DNA binding protein